MKNNKIFLLGGIALGAWYLYDHFEEPGNTATKKKSSGTTSTGAPSSGGMTKKQQKASDAEKKKAKNANHGNWFDWFYDNVFNMGSVNSTATDEQEYQGAAKDKANLAKSGPFKGYMPTGMWSAWLNDPAAQKWLKTSAGKSWSEKVQGYLAAAKKSGGLTKGDIDKMHKYVPLPSSAPTEKYKDARGVWYYRKGDQIWKAKDQSAPKSAAEKKIESAPNTGGHPHSTLFLGGRHG